MKWSEVRTLHPNKFVLLEKLKESLNEYNNEKIKNILKLSFTIHQTDL